MSVNAEHGCGHDAKAVSGNAASTGPLRIHADTSSLVNDFDNNSTRLATATALTRFVSNWFGAVLSTKQVSGNLTLTNVTVCGEVTIPDDHLTNGLPDTDVVLYFSMKSSSVCSSGNYVAHAIHCVQDHLDRPIAGNVNLCPSTAFASKVEESDSWSVQSTLQTMIHESTHVLALSASLLPYYRSPTGIPYTPRDANGHPISDVPSTYKIVSVNSQGVTVTKYAFPAMLAKARAWSGCSSLNGIEMESQWGASTAGSHIEKRVFSSDYMTGQATTGVDTDYSEMSLAFFEDSGWYQVDYTYATNPAIGQNSGCGFATTPCLSTPTDTNQILPSNPAFCNGSIPDRCAAGRYSKGYCGVSSSSRDSGTVPAEYRYFNSSLPLNLTDASYKGGYVPLMDYCPTYMPYGSFSSQQGKMNSDCRFASNAPSVNNHGEAYGPSSRCFEHSIGSPSDLFASGCFSVSCYTVPTTGSAAYRVKANGVDVDCGVGGANAPASNGSIYCAPATEICPAGLSVECENGCFARGTCRNNGNTNYCLCKPGFTGLDCSGFGYEFSPAGKVLSNMIARSASSSGATGPSGIDSAAIALMSIVGAVLLLSCCAMAAFYMKGPAGRLKAIHQASGPAGLT
ncbi:hypothetical protein SeLEV6574_g01280 [Synchytrium endobioticum]|nr:hypothetical protein SeLEV6574_g01280 [Synchytrium endobioticum]